MKSHQYSELCPDVLENPIDTSYGFYLHDFVRQEGRKVFIYDNQKKLLVDYDLQVGDTVKTETYAYGRGEWVITQRETFSINNEDRILLTASGGPFDEVMIYEGVGYLNGVDGSFGGEMFYEGFLGLGFSIELACYGENGQTLWLSNPSESRCDILLPADEIWQESTIDVYPSPIGNILTVSSEVSQMYFVRLLDASGAEVLRKVFDNRNHLELMKSSLRRGMYFLEITCHNGQSFRQKIVKN